VAHAYNPIYLGDHWEDEGSRLIWTNSSEDPNSTNKKLCMVVHTVILDTQERSRRWRFKINPSK
jgi:hypothetical protein